MAEPLESKRSPLPEQAAGEGTPPLTPTQALAQLFDAHNRALRSFLMARLGNDEEVKGSGLD